MFPWIWKPFYACCHNGNQAKNGSTSAQLVLFDIVLWGFLLELTKIISFDYWAGSYLRRSNKLWILMKFLWRQRLEYKLIPSMRTKVHASDNSPSFTYEYLHIYSGATYRFQKWFRWSVLDLTCTCMRVTVNHSSITTFFLWKGKPEKKWNKSNGTLKKYK